MMTISIVLRLGQGNFERDGFPVSLQVLANGQLIHQEIDRDRIPAAPEILNCYESFREPYTRLGETRGLERVQDQTTHAAYQQDLETCRIAIRRLETTIEHWFEHQSFQTLQAKILLKTAQVPSGQAIPIMIDADTTLDEQNIQLQKLPWHLWQLFAELPNAEPVLAAKIETQVNPLTRSIRVLAILGSSEGGLELSDDERGWRQLEQLGAKIHCANQPTREELHNLLWDNSWDILFFAGHSASQKGCTEGSLQISDQQTIPLRSLRQDLMRAVQRGLKLAIFNSCDGLGIASELIQLKIPSMVVMREPVPDLVARKFLKYFLKDFSEGRSLYRAVQEARKRLQAQEDDHLNPCPAASWLPIVCQNPNQPELVWSVDSSAPELPISDLPARSRQNHWRKIALLGVGLLLLSVLGFCTQQKSSQSPTTATTATTDFLRLSLGKTILTSNVTETKRRGSQAFAAGKYEDAIEAFEASLKEQRNDPEALIYQNNAIANLSSKRLRIAVSVPIGNNPNVAAEILRGVAQAQNQINRDEKGINGAKLEIIIADDRNNENFARQAAEKFVEDRNVLAVIGHNASNASQAAVPTYQKNGLVMITPTSYASAITGYANYIFQTVPTAQALAEPLAEYIGKTKQFQKIAVCFDSRAKDNETFRAELGKALSKFNSEIVKTGICDVSAKNFNANEALDEAHDRGAKALVLSPYIDLIGETTVLAEANQKRYQLPLFGSPSFYTQETLKAGTAIEGLIIPAAWHPDVYPKTPFLVEAERLWGTPLVSWRTAMSYDAAVILIAALQQSQSRSGIQAALVHPKLLVEGAEGAGSKVTFNQDRVRNLPIQLVQVRRKSAEEAGAELGFSLFNSSDRTP